MPFRCYPMNHLRDGGFRGGCFLHLLQPGVKKTHIFTPANGKKRRANKCLPSPFPFTCSGGRPWPEQRRTNPMAANTKKGGKPVLYFTWKPNQTKNVSFQKPTCGKIIHLQKLDSVYPSFLHTKQPSFLKKCLTSKRGLKIDASRLDTSVETCLLLLATPDRNMNQTNQVPSP